MLNSQSMFVFLKRPLVERPPSRPLPDPSSSAAWYGELFIRYPGREQIFPVYLGTWFRARVDLACVLNEISRQAFDRAESEPPLTLGESLAFKRSIERWLQALPDCLSVNNMALPHHLKLQYVTITDQNCLSYMEAHGD